MTCALAMVFFASEALQAAKPNFIIIFADDQGYGDLSCFGSKTIRYAEHRPHCQGRPEIYEFHGSLTGLHAFPGRRCSPVAIPSALVCISMCLFPTSTKGLNPKEHTIADHLKGQDYATACFGKWHLGHHKEVLPTSNGFDTYFGIPYSNDMNHPDNKGKPKGGWAGMDILWDDPEVHAHQVEDPAFRG